MRKRIKVSFRENEKQRTRERGRIWESELENNKNEWERIEGRKWEIGELRNRKWERGRMKER